VNKIKNRFHQYVYSWFLYYEIFFFFLLFRNPNIYKTFLEILHTYQKQQKDAKELSTG
jgi:hypothetical protein